LSVDLTPVVNALLALASVAVTAAIPIIVPALLKRLKIANDSDLAARIEEAANAAAGKAYRYALSHEGGLSNIAVQDAALATGINHVVTSVPGALEALGITQDHVQEMVTARLGSLLATDPSVTAVKTVTPLPAIPTPAAPLPPAPPPPAPPV
jgi:hypothetical protein